MRHFFMGGDKKKMTIFLQEKDIVNINKLKGSTLPKEKQYRLVVPRKTEETPFIKNSAEKVVAVLTHQELGRLYLA